VLAAAGFAFLGEPSGPREAVAQGAPRRAWLGVELDAAPGGGVLAKHVVTASPAKQAGLADGDVIVSADGALLDAPQQLVARVALVGPGNSLRLHVRRGSAERDVPVTLAPFPGADQLLRLDKLGTFAPSWGPLAPVAGSVPANISQLRGRVVVLDFWATWCAPCRLMAPQLSRWQSSYGAQGLAVVGVTSDPVPVAYRTAQALDLRYPVASDARDATASLYGVHALPTMFVVDKRGVIREVFVGYDPSRHKEIERLLLTLLAEPAPGP
jgi:thiol-disulfide isomerase/thioredoxin